MKSASHPVKSFLSILFSPLAILVIILLATSFHIAHAQYDDLSVHIAKPYEGETLYAGPSSLIYRVPVSGWVVSDVSDPNQIVVRLEIIKGSQIIGVEQQNLRSDGTYSFSITVNPKSSLLSFTATQEWCTTSCHSPGSLDLQPGDLNLRVTATTPAGDQVSTQHHVFVEHSDYAVLPVQVLRSDGSGEDLEGIHVSASTWLYIWRARSASGLTDRNGYVELQVEALTRGTTTHSITIESTTIDGVLYTGGDSEQITLPPGASTAAPLTLTISSSSGQISGSILGFGESLEQSIPIAAIQLPHGAVFRTHTASDGTFSFSNLPIAQYLVTVDNPSLDEANLTAFVQETDLRISTEGSVYIPTREQDGFSILGNVLDEESHPIPFAWITVEGTPRVQKVVPSGGALSIKGLSPETDRLKIDAPGFYSQDYVLDLTTESVPNLNLTLKLQADTLRMPWGDGEVFVPPASNTILSEGSITLRQGWLWGRNSTGGHLAIQTPKANIMIFQADFALEYLHDQSAWLYVFSGQADVMPVGDGKPIVLHEGQMVNLLSTDSIRPVPIDPFVIQTLQSDSTFLPSPVWEPTSGDKFQSWVKDASIKAVQFLTIAVYSLILISIVVVPIIAIARWWRARSTE